MNYAKCQIKQVVMLFKTRLEKRPRERPEQREGRREGGKEGERENQNGVQCNYAHHLFSAKFRPALAPLLQDS